MKLGIFTDRNVILRLKYESNTQTNCTIDRRCPRGMRRSGNELKHRYVELRDEDREFKRSVSNGELNGQLNSVEHKRSGAGNSDRDREHAKRRDADARHTKP